MVELRLKEKQTSAAMIEADVVVPNDRTNAIKWSELGRARGLLQLFLKLL